MRYLCEKQLTLGGKIYYPGNIIPDGIILPERSSKLSRNGYISEINEMSKEQSEMYTQKQVDHMLEEAIQEAVDNTIAKMEQKQKEMQQEIIENANELNLGELTAPAAYEGAININVTGSDKENDMITSLFVTQEEIQQVFSIMELNADDGAKAIADVKSDNVLILLHAADSRKTIKNAAKEQANKLFSDEKVSDIDMGSNANAESSMMTDEGNNTDTGAKGADA